MKYFLFTIIFLCFSTTSYASESCAYIPNSSAAKITFCQTNSEYRFEHKVKNISWQKNRAEVESYLRNQIKLITLGTAYPKLDWSKTKVEAWVTASKSDANGTLHFIVTNDLISFQFTLNQDIQFWPDKLGIMDARINVKSNTPNSNKYVPTSFVALLTQTGDLEYKEVEKLLKSFGATNIMFEVVFPLVFFNAGKGFDEQETINKISNTQQFDLYFSSLGIDLNLDNFKIQVKAFEF